MVPFTFNNGQRYVWDRMADIHAKQKAMWLVILKARQGAGISTFCCGWIHWQLWRQTDVQTMTVAHQVKTAETMIETMRIFHDEMTPELRPQLRAGNRNDSIPRGEIYYADRRTWGLIQVASNLDPRGQQVTHVHETEVAMYKDVNELNGALLPQLPTLGSEAFLRSSFIIESTPKGENEFYEMWQEARQVATSRWNPIWLPWWLMDDEFSAPAPDDFELSADDERIQKSLTRDRMELDGKPVTREQMWWRRSTIDDVYRGDLDGFDQEYPSDEVTCFLLQTKSIFGPHMKYVQKCVHDSEERASEAWKARGIECGKHLNIRLKFNVREDFTDKKDPVKYAPDPHGPWTIWEPPVRGHQYVIGADCAEGLSQGDFSAAVIIDVSLARQCGEFRAKVSPEKFADQLDAAGRWYNNALLVPEVNNLGYVVLARLTTNLVYPNLYKWPKWDEAAKYSGKRGWVTQGSTKGILVSRMIYVLEEQSVRVASRRLMSEMSTYYQNKSKTGDIDAFGASKGSHDDLVMSFGMAVMGIMQTPKLAASLKDLDDLIPSAKALSISAAMDRSPTLIAKDISPYKDEEIPWHPMLGPGAMPF